MSDTDDPQAIREFIGRHIDSVVQLEVLLLLYNAADRQWTAEAIARELRIDPVWVSDQLGRLCDDGLLHCSSAPTPAYRFQARTEALRRVVEALAVAYADRRVSIISLIYSKPAPAKPTNDPLKSFSDAFRFRKDRPNG